ncbi:MAG TPA: iron-containing alcohol dehydrogenase [Myxococcota bacterium]|nr:iron-containing alcohol dehydrogenase [Myxococcota bacterium]
MRGNWNYPTPIRFGAGRIAELPQAARDLGIHRALLVTDRGLAALPMVADAVDRLRTEGIPAEVFSEIKPNPTGSDVARGVEALRAGGFDGVIAFGGGSALDAAKAIAMMWRQTRPLFDFEDRADWWTRIDADGMAPVVAVPTTSGTGSEVGRASVIVDEAVHVKKIIFHPKMLPGRVIADPALTVGLPPFLTAATGIDALSHLLEAWCAPGFHPMADGIAVEGIRLVHRSLLAAYHDGSDLDARAQMMAASLMGATAFQKGLGAMHSIAHVVGAHLDAHHGLLNAIVMPWVLEHNRPAIEGRIAHLAHTLGLDPSFEAFVGWVRDLRRATQTPDTLAAVGVTDAHVPAFAAESVDDPSTGSNPLPMDAAAFERLYRRALGLG